MWHPVSTAPFDHDLELAIIDSSGVHAIAVPCCRILGAPDDVGICTVMRLAEELLGIVMVIAIQSRPADSVAGPGQANLFFANSSATDNTRKSSF
jgi:hypothetical protein